MAELKFYFAVLAGITVGTVLAQRTATEWFMVVTAWTAFVAFCKWQDHRQDRRQRGVGQ